MHEERLGLGGPGRHWGGATEEEYEFPPKPPRMRWATYNRLEEQYDELENRWALGIMTRFARYTK